MDYEHSNYLIDVIMPEVSGNSFKVIAAVARETWGWQREQVKLSIADFKRLTGIGSHNTLKTAVSGATEFIEVTPLPNEQGFIFRMLPLRVGTMSGIDIVPTRTISENDIVPLKNGRVLCQKLTRYYVRKYHGTMSEVDKPSIYIKKKKEEEERKGNTPPTPQPAVNSIPFKPSPNNSKHPAGQADERTSAILDVCKLKASIPNHLRQADEAAVQLCDYSPDFIRNRYTYTDNPNGVWYWYRDDWRGKKGQPPRPDNIVETISVERVAVATAVQGGNDTMERLKRRIQQEEMQ